MRVEVSIILPTTARRRSLLSALDSIVQPNIEVRPIVVVNGMSPDPEILRNVEEREGIVLIREDRADFRLALRIGLKEVATPYFCFLDDDDIYLDAAIETRLEAIKRTGADLLVTNGVVKTATDCFPLLGSVEELGDDPLSAMLGRGNWLASCGGLFRAATIGPEEFADLPAYAEWTYLGVKLAAKKRRISFIADQTFRIHHTPNSLSDSNEYHEGVCRALDQMTTLDLPKDAMLQLNEKRVNSTHGLAELYLRAGDRGRAWSRHLRTLILPGGLRYIGFTRYLLGASLPDDELT